MNEFPADHVIQERYKVVALLGAGGMGAVYLVEDLITNHKCALKTILASAPSDRILKRFEMEARATKMLNHPNLVQVLDYGFISESQPYLVMEYCEGQDLSSVIRSEGSLCVESALDIFITICNALTYAHTQGVVHRDLKPSNVMISNAEIKVLDFGIAKIFTADTQFNTITQTGEIIGSPYYMSPEQCLGKAVDLRSDVYSLGCMLYESLTGAPPFAGETALATMLMHQSRVPLSLKEASLGKIFPVDLERIVSRMLAKNAASRYPDLLQAAEDLRRVRKGESIAEWKEIEQERPLDKRLWIAVAAVPVVCGIIVAWLLHPSFRQSYEKQFGPEPPKVAKIPAEESIREMLPAHSGFYSVFKSKSDKVRDFQFPEHSIGDYGYGDNLHSYIPARKLQRGVAIPFSLHIKQDAKAIACFRNDEVCNLTYRGYMVQDNDTDAIKNWSLLTSLNMDDTAITDAAIANFKGLKKLKSLSLSDTNVTGKGLLNLNIGQMFLLDLNHIPQASILLSRIRDGNSIVHLSLIGDNLTDEDAKILGDCQKLNTLNILDNEVSDKGLEHLTKLKSLGSLWIDGRNLTANSVSIFKRMNLGRLTIDKCPWTREQALQFRKALRRGNNTLGKLDIKYISEKPPVNDRF